MHLMPEVEARLLLLTLSPHQPSNAVMPNIPALVGLVQTLVRPGLIVPHVVVRDIAALDWTALHGAGVRHVVCDKDNCLVSPRSLSLGLGVYADSARIADEAARGCTGPCS